MGTFPGFDESNRLSAGSPVEANSATNRTSGAAFADIGDAMQKVGNMWAIEKAEQGINQSKLAAEEAHIYAQTSSKADGSDFQQNFQKSFNNKTSKIIAGMDPLAASHFNKQFAGVKSLVQTQGLRTSFDMKITDFKVTSEENRNIVASAILSAPETAKGEIENSLIKRTSRVDAGIPENIANEEHFKTRDAYLGAYVEGMVNLGRGDTKLLSQLKKEITATEDPTNVKLTVADKKAYNLTADGKLLIAYNYPEGGKVDPYMSELLRSMTPELKNRIVDKIDAEFDNHTKVKISHIDKVLKAAKNTINDTGELNASRTGEVNTVMAAVPPELREEYAAKHQIIMELKQVAGIVRDPNPETGGMSNALNYLQSFLPTEKDSLLVRQAKLDLVSDGTEMLKKLSEVMSADSAKFLQKYPDIAEAKKAVGNDPVALQAYHTKLEVRAKALGIPISYVEREDAIFKATEFKMAAAVGGDEMIKVMTAFRSFYGDDSQQAMVDILKHDPSLPPEILLAGVLDNPTTLTEISTNISRAKKIGADFSAMADVTKGDLKLEMDGSRAAMFELVGRGPLLDGLNSYVRNRAMRYVVDDSLSVKDAVIKAETAIMGNFGNVYAGPETVMNWKWLQSKNQNVLIPNLRKYNTGAMQKFLVDNSPGSEVLSFTNEGVRIPDNKFFKFEDSSLNVSGQFPVVVGLPRSKQLAYPEGSANGMSERTLWNSAILRLTGDGTGLQVMVKGFVDGFGDVKQWKPVYSKKTGQPMMISLDDASKYNRETSEILPSKPVAKEEVLSEYQKEKEAFAKELGFNSDAEARAAADKIPEHKPNPYYDSGPTVPEGMEE